VSTLSAYNIQWFANKNVFNNVGMETVGAV